MAKFGLETEFGSHTWCAGRLVSFRMSVDFPKEIRVTTLLWLNCLILCFYSGLIACYNILIALLVTLSILIIRNVRYAVQSYYMVN